MHADPDQALQIITQCPHISESLIGFLVSDYANKKEFTQLVLVAIMEFLRKVDESEYYYSQILTEQFLNYGFFDKLAQSWACWFNDEAHLPQDLKYFNVLNTFLEACDECAHYQVIHQILSSECLLTIIFKSSTHTNSYIQTEALKTHSICLEFIRDMGNCDLSKEWIEKLQLIENILIVILKN